MKRKAIIAITAIALIAVVFYGSSQARPLAPGLKVGVLISSSGPLYFAAGFQKAAAELAIRDLAKSVDVEIFYQDAGDTDRETNTALSVFSRNKVDLILAPIESDSARRVLKSRELPDVPIIAPSSIAENITKNRKILRLASTVSQDSFALAKYIATKSAEVVAVVSASDEYSKSVSRSVAFGLSLRSVRVKNVALSDTQALKRIDADALVLVTMESSVELLQELPNWLTRFDQVYLVPGNLANYSAYSFAKDLSGAIGLLAAEEHSQGFRQRLANLMDRPEILAAPNSPMFSLAQRTYQAIIMAAEQLRAGESVTDLAKTGNFTAEGYYTKTKYSVLRYSKAGVYSVIGQFDPKIP